MWFTANYFEFKQPQILEALVLATSIRARVAMVAQPLTTGPPDYEMRQRQYLPHRRPGTLQPRPGTRVSYLTTMVLTHA